MGAADQDTPESSATPALPADDLPPGPAGWEAYRVRAFWNRVGRAEEEGRPVSGPPGERVRVAERPRPLPPADALEELLADLLDAACGPLARPGSRRGDPERRRRAALRRLVRDLLPGRRPVHPARWALLGDRALEELDRRRPHVPDPEAEAVLRAALLALRDHRVTDAPLDVEALSRAFRSGARDAYASDLVGPGWRAESEGAEERAARRRLEAEIEEATSGRAGLADSGALEEIRRRRVESRAEELTSAQRTVYLRVERDGWTPAEVAEALGITAAAARNRLRRARRALAG